jgi:peptidoglycan hydrolase-like protein with peptidoglycan-binding domain
MLRTAASLARLRRVTRFTKSGPARAVAAAALTVGLLAMPAASMTLGSGSGISVAEAAARGCPRTLAMGDRGADVKRLQRELSRHFRTVDSQSAFRDHPPLIAEDGVFGATTAVSVARYQEEIGVLADTVVGPETWRALKVC